MVRKTSLLALVVGLLVASSFVGAAAFTSATVERDVSVDVATDDNAIVKLSGGTADATTVTNDKLQIKPEGSQSSPSFNGLNQDATFTYGDKSTASAAETSNAFTITNNDDIAHSFGFSTTGPLEYTIAYDSDGTGTPDTKMTFDSSDSEKSVDLQSGETAYVVVTVDTGTGTGTESGTLTISASDTSA
jgi:hypothetical protein